MAEAKIQGILDAQKKTWNDFAPGWGKWDQFFMRTIAPMGEALLDATDLKPGMRVLDVATGTGEPGLSAARRVAPGQVIGIDIAESMVKLAQANAIRQEIRNFSAEVREASALPFQDSEFDAVICRLGIMFFGDTVATLSKLRRIMKPLGHAAFSSWAEPAGNPWATLASGIVFKSLGLQPPPLEAPGLFRFSQAEKLKEVFFASGFTNFELREIKGEMNFATPALYWEFITDVVAPIARALSGAPPEKTNEIRESVIAEAEKRISSSGLSFPWKAMIGVTYK